ncbi:nickel pincer cofactor biosynthesis protein LarC [Clostridium sp. BNL1100]|uniref:nickel pincer cofactor biosynthesis protein LarC n=1 Tax=Clostridium sp. BNL1100 TaxID=755731 RepID=UPI00024A72C7|nr:nickel pincer cofactor biosynthesis protein LarC [Clostridium sp. BNL1100]AEY66802.1 TIGR00299 family protein [Clostridium sp. BNL1100]
MKVLYFDCFSGISGDMTLGALLDLGIDKAAFLTELEKLKVDGYSIEINKKIKNGIRGTDVHVVLEETGHHEDGEEHQYGEIHHTDHHHHGEHGHTHENAHEHTHNHHSERNLEDIELIINHSDLRPRVKSMSTKIFREIARAEAKVHGKDINEVHFHEVGAVDSIVDIVGSCICIDMLGIERIFASELHEGKGFVKCAHGLLPVPVPAVMEMLCSSKIPLITEDIPFELVTPTGLGIIKMISSGFGKMPPMSIEKTGYGMGKRETGRFNALRVVMGSLYQQDMMPNDEISILETNIDNMSPEIMGYTMEKLLDSGALDVYYTPIYMKKNRPSAMLTVLVKCGEEKKISDIIFSETSTIGIRISHSQRFCMDRELVKVNTQYGDVRVKVANIGDIMKFAPEYEDCRSIALKTGMPIKEVYELVNEKYRQEGYDIAVQ